MSSQHARSARLEARISPDMLAVIRRAAEIQGRSVSDFVVAAALEAAQRTIEDMLVIRLSLEDQRLLMDAISNPPELNVALCKAADAYERILVTSR